MKKEVADAWIKALRSGEYKQIKRVLKDNEGYCCLGVLCEISGLSYHKVDGNLPDSVVEYAGMKDRDGTYPGTFTSERGKELNNNLWIANDHMNKSFNEIADIIEQHWEVL